MFSDCQLLIKNCLLVYLSCADVRFVLSCVEMVKVMKKSKLIVLGLTLTLAACRQTPKDEWTSGNDDPTSRDTTVNNRPYRSYHGFFYPIIGGFISPNSYRGASMQDISRPGFTPSKVSRGGFGGSSNRTSS